LEEAQQLHPICRRFRRLLQSALSLIIFREQILSVLLRKDRVRFDELIGLARSALKTVSGGEFDWGGTSITV